MRLSTMEVESAGINVKAWLGEMHKAARAPGGPTFSLKGPCTLDVRKRRTGGVGGTVSKARYAFMGGEEFRIGGIVADRDDRNDSIFISVTLTPAKMALASEISGMSLSLLECIELLEGFEAWSETFGEVKYKEPAKKPLSLSDQRESNAMWGAW